MASDVNRKLSLGVKLALLIAVLTIGGVSVFGITVLNKQNQLQDEQLQDLGGALVAQVASAATEPLFTGDNMSLQLQVEQSTHQGKIKAIEIVSSDGTIVVSAGDHEALLRAASSGSMYYFVTDVVFRQISGGRVALLLDHNEMAKTYKHLLKLILGVGAGLSVLAVIGALLIGRRINKPFAELLYAAKQVGSGNYKSAVVEEDRRQDEVGQLLHAISDMGQGLYQKEQVEAMLAGFVNQDIAKRVIAEAEEIRIKGERVEATVLFADIVGFTSMSEGLTPEQVADLLNEYFSYFTHCSDLYFGTVDKFIGDCAMVVFGAPKPNADHQFQALACAVLMQKLTKVLNRRREACQLPAVSLRIGINSGPMLAGVLGSEKKMEYTVVGDSVNLASRLCGEAEGGQIIITEDFERALERPERAMLSYYKKINIRGKSLPVQTYVVDDVISEYKLTMDSLIDDLMTSKTSLT
ncbi:adenylate cyclase [Sinobacterium caligoides]|uniref:Adenylate cyclase n=1 Tax=Sinobacterium caligoides TaxID=933926 RepID=A0A3N2DY46_9GAMM|nr:adenylate/guanylate cyclase domain-containing protein [Sinobacterium caligoides]ROS04761.1 adenylate cyclase [Sinobacterium caligoides]